MSLRGNFKEVVEFLNLLRGKASNPQIGKYLTVDFDKISVLMPGAALVLATELYRWQELSHIILKPFKPHKWDSEIVRLFNEMGIWELLHTSKEHKIKQDKKPGPQTFFKFLSGTFSEGELANRLMETMAPIIGLNYDEKLLYVALSEAMTNVVQHAYPDKSDLYETSLKNRWWLSGSFDRDARMMTVLIFDHGVGIARTLPKWSMFDDVLKFFKDRKSSFTNHGELIQAAIEIGRTRTKEGHRGKGLNQILNFSSNSDFGRLYIASRKGVYIFNEECEEKTQSSPVELGGTFIQWEIKLNKDTENGELYFKNCKGIH